MSSLEVVLHIPAGPQKPEQIRQVTFEDDITTQTRLDGFHFLSIFHLPGPLDVLRIQPHNDDRSSTKEHNFFDLKRGEKVRIFAYNGPDHRFLLINHNSNVSKDQIEL